MSSKASKDSSDDDTIDFGFKQVRYNDKAKLVGDIFTDVASKYDLMNDLMSFGQHHFWKNNLVNEIKDLNGKILDVAGGTGDIALRIARRARDNGMAPQIVVSDINYNMLSVGRDKSIDENLIKYLQFANCDAEILPFGDKHFDYYTISFGIRNVTNRAKALEEAYRVLKPGGRFLCLEFAPAPKHFSLLYDKFSFKVIPAIGKLITGNKEAYDYLVESIRTFPTPAVFAAMISDAGFKDVTFNEYSFGVATLYSGYKL